MFSIATKIPFFYETVETAPIYKFMIHLDGVTQEIGKEGAKEALTDKIGNQLVSLRDISTDRNGKIA